jgi:hypothetical protein
MVEADETDSGPAPKRRLIGKKNTAPVFFKITRRVQTTSTVVLDLRDQEPISYPPVTL